MELVALFGSENQALDVSFLDVLCFGCLYFLIRSLDEKFRYLSDPEKPAIRS